MAGFFFLHLGHILKMGFQSGLTHPKQRNVLSPWAVNSTLNSEYLKDTLRNHLHSRYTKLAISSPELVCESS